MIFYPNFVKFSKLGIVGYILRCKCVMFSHYIDIIMNVEIVFQLIIAPLDDFIELHEWMVFKIKIHDLLFDQEFVMSITYSLWSQIQENKIKNIFFILNIRKL